MDGPKGFLLHSWHDHLDSLCKIGKTSTSKGNRCTSHHTALSLFLSTAKNRMTHVMMRSCTPRRHLGTLLTDIVPVVLQKDVCEWVSEGFTELILCLDGKVLEGQVL